MTDPILKTTLYKQDIDFAFKIANFRNHTHEALDKIVKTVIKGESLQRHFEGVQGELAVSKILDLPYDGDPLPEDIWKSWRKKGTDVCGLEVRTNNRQNGDLFLYDTDKDDSPYLLVIKTGYDFQIAGWIFGRNGKTKKYWEFASTRPLLKPCYLIPQTDLNGTKSLLSILEMVYVTRSRPRNAK